MNKLTAQDESNLTWFVREAASEVSGLGAQNYGGVGGGGGVLDPDRIRQSQLMASRRYARIEAIRARMQEMEGGIEAWGVLAIAFGVPRRDDPLPVYEEVAVKDVRGRATTKTKKKVVREGLPTETANLARFTASALAAGAALAGKELPRYAHERAVLAIHAAIEAKASGDFLMRVRVEAREMLDAAGERYVIARRELDEEERVRRAQKTQPAEPLENLSGLLDTMRAEDALKEQLRLDTERLFEDLRATA